jgi:hypothetical protein
MVNDPKLGPMNRAAGSRPEFLHRDEGSRLANQDVEALLGPWGEVLKLRDVCLALVAERTAGREPTAHLAQFIPGVWPMLHGESQ